MPIASARTRIWSSWRCRTWSRSARCRSSGTRGGKSSTSPPTIGCATPRSTRRGTRRRTSTRPASRRQCTGWPSCTGRRATRGACPGCYAMGAILATAPLMKSGLGSREGIVVDGKSGVTGAGAQGRKIDPMYLYTEANENVQAYGMATHRHTPEIEQEMSALAGGPVVVAFTPHLVPLNRGLFTTASVPLTRSVSTADLVALYSEFYAGEPFVRVLPEGERPTTRHIVGSNFCDVTVVADLRTRRAVCVSALDNLGKGGSANGIQNLNVMMGWDERSGLEAPPVYPEASASPMSDIQWLEGGITAVPGILAAGITAGIKPSGKKDLALIYSSSPARAAAVFTTNQVK